MATRRAERRGSIRSAAALLVLAGLLLSGPASGQVPDPPPIGGPSGESYLVLNLGVVGDQAYAFIRPGGQVRIQLEVQDLSADRAQDARNPIPHTVQLETTIASPEKPPGWTATIGNNTHFTAPGTTVFSTLIVNALFAATDNYVTIWVNGTLIGSDGTSRVTDGLEVKVQLLPFYAGRARILTPPATLGQQEYTRYAVEVENQATYPDWFAIHLNATEGLKVSGPDRVYVPPLEKRVVNITLYTPRTGLYEFGKLYLVALEIRSQSDPGFRYQTSAIVTVKGFYVPAWWVPLTLFGVVGAALLISKGMEKRAEAAAREGRPRRPTPTAKQAVLLAELRKRDPAAHKEKMQAFAALYAARRDAWKASRKTRAVDERRTEREQRRAAKAEKKRRAREKAEAAEREAALEKLRREKLKVLAAKQKVLDREAAKEAKVASKAEAKRKKELMKLQKRKSKELAKARKAAAKAEKAARKAEKKGRRPPGESPAPPEGQSSETPNE